MSCVSVRKLSIANKLETSITINNMKK